MRTRRDGRCVPNVVLTLSLALNVAVLAAVLFGMITGRAWVAEAYGPPSPARAILQSIYGAILLVSLWLLAARDVRAASALLLVQVLYKCTTPWTVRSLRNPVVLSNLAIAVVHSVTLWSVRSSR